MCMIFFFMVNFLGAVSYAYIIDRSAAAMLKSNIWFNMSAALIIIFSYCFLQSFLNRYQLRIHNIIGLILLQHNFHQSLLLFA